MLTERWESVGYLKEIIRGWYERSQGEIIEYSIFDQFIALWVSFNAWGRHLSDKETDRQMIEWAKNYNSVKRAFQSKFVENTSFKMTLRQLKAEGPIPRHREYKGSKHAEISDISNWNDILEVIYVIRCNLFHGRKSLEDYIDIQLVEHAFNILSPVFGEIINEYIC